MERRFTGKVAFVTGAGSGIGRGIAERFAREGAAVAIADISEAGLAGTIKQMKKLKAKCFPVRLDVSKPADIKQAVAKVVAEFGRIDVLVNAAGVVQSKGLLEVTEEDWDRIIDVNQKGTAFMCQAVGAQMVKQVPASVKKKGKTEKMLRQDRQFLLDLRPPRQVLPDPLRFE